MRSALERRQQMLEYLSDHRFTTYSELASEFGISRRTAVRDIEELTCSAPIFTVQGNGGGSFYGSRIYSDRPTNNRNYMELKNVPERLKGSDYFVFAYEGFYKKFSEAAEDGNKNIISGTNKLF